MRYEIETLTPLHIGSGESFDGLSYIQDLNTTPSRVYYIDYRDLEKVLDFNHWSTFLNWIESRRRGGACWDDFFQEKIRDQKMLREFLANLRPPLTNLSKQKRIRGTIDSCIRSGNDPIIPGSALKGSLRSALAYQVLKEQEEEYVWLKEKLNGLQGNRDRDTQRRITGISQQLENRVFRSTKKQDAKYDLLKYLMVGDSLPIEEKDLFVSEILTLNIGRRFSVFLELWPKKMKTTIDFGFQPRHLSKQGFQKKQEMIANDSVLLQAAYTFAKDLLSHEKEWFQNEKRLDIVEIIAHLKEKNTPHEPLLRLGKHEGFLSTTISLLIKERDPALFHEVIRVGTRGRSYPHLFPKTRKLVYEGKGWNLLGWIQFKQKEK